MNGAASFINKVFFLQWHVRNINRFIWREKETAPLYTQAGRAYTVACWGCSLQFSHSLAQNHCGHISNIPADHVRRGKGWMLSVDAVAVADGENPLSARPDQGSPPFSLTKPVRLPSSIAHCRDVGSCLLPPPSSRLSYVPTSLRYNSLYSRLAPLLQLPTSLHVDISLLLCPAHTSTGFYVLYL